MKLFGNKTHLFLLTGIFVLGSVLIFVNFVNQTALPESGFDFGGKRKEILHPQKPLTQTFHSSQDFFAVDLGLRNVGSNLPGQISIELRDQNCQTVLAQAIVKNQRIKNHRFYRVEFPRHTRDNPFRSGKYCLRLLYQTTEPLSKSKFPQLSSSKRAYREDEKLINTGAKNPHRDRRAVLRTVYDEGSFLNNARELNNRLSQYKPEVFKGTALTVLALLFVVGTLTLVLALIGLNIKGKVQNSRKPPK